MKKMASQKMPRQDMDMKMPSADEMRRMMDTHRMNTQSGRPVKARKKK